MIRYPEYDGLNTDDEVIDALISIAKKDNTTFNQIWEDGYTERHNVEEITKLVKRHILKNTKIEDLEEFYNWGCCEKVWIIKKENSRISIEDSYTEVIIVADDIEDMIPYVKKLFEWATTAWDYDAVEDWNTDEYSTIETQKGYFKVHKLGKDDKHGLFLGLYDDSPEPLEDYEDREIHAYVYIKITKEEFQKIKCTIQKD